MYGQQWVMKNESSKWSTIVDDGLFIHDGDIFEESEYDMCLILFDNDQSMLTMWCICKMMKEGLPVVNDDSYALVVDNRNDLWVATYVKHNCWLVIGVKNYRSWMTSCSSRVGLRTTKNQHPPTINRYVIGPPLPCFKDILTLPSLITITYDWVKRGRLAKPPVLHGSSLVAAGRSQARWGSGRSTTRADPNWLVHACQPPIPKSLKQYKMSSKPPTSTPVISYLICYSTIASGTTCVVVALVNV